MLNPRLDRLTGYPFQRLRERLSDLAPPDGLAPIALSIGEPQHAPPPVITPLLVQHERDWSRYPLIDGTPDFRAAVADWLCARYRLATGAVDPDRHVLPVAGTREALFLSGLIAVPEAKGGGRPLALVPNPYYHVWAGSAAMAGATPVFLSATRDNAFSPRLSDLDRATLDRVAVAVICSPGNPCGGVAALDDIMRAVELARRHDFVLLSDECYSEIYADEPPAGALEACARLGGGFDNVLVFNSLSKRSSAPGLRSGFVAGDARLISAFKRLRSYAATAVPYPILAVSAALWRDEAHVAENRALYRAKFDAAADILGDRYGFFRPRGGFFLWLEVGNGEEAARALWREAALRVLPGAYIAEPDARGVNPGQAYIRVALVHDLPTTAEALRRLVTVLR